MKELQSGLLGPAALAIAGRLAVGMREHGRESAGQSRRRRPPMRTVEGGINVQPGSEEDFMVNVGRRTFFTQELRRSR